MIENKQNKRPNVPPLRFPEFTEPWERKKLSDFTERVTRKNKGQTNLPLTISAQYGLVDQISFFNNKVASADMSNYYLLKRGEFTYNKSYSSDYPLGAVKRLDLYDMGALSTLYICFKIAGDINSDFLVHYFESPKWHRGVYEIAGEGARNHGLLNIAVGDYFETQHYVPSNLKEQKKIASMLNLIQRRIEVQSKLIEDLQQLKSALTNKFIEKLVATSLLIPFSDIYETAGEGGTPDTSKSEYYERGTIPFIKIDDLSNKYLQENKDYITELGLKKSSAWVVPKQSVIFSNGATIGAISINTYDVTTKQGILGIVPKATVDVEFLYYLMTSTYFTKQIHRIITHGTMATAYLKDINKIKVPLPIIKEQKLIVKILSSISRKQEIEEQILNQLKIQKQYLLGQMFI